MPRQSGLLGCVELPVTFVVDVLVLQEGTQLVVSFCVSLEKTDGGAGEGRFQGLAWAQEPGARLAGAVLGSSVVGVLL